MAESQNVQIPLSLFKKLIALMEYINFSEFCFPKTFKYNDILMELRDKQLKINKHMAYSQMVRAKDEDQRNNARRNYIKLKSK